MSEAARQYEVLVIDKDERVLRGLEKLLGEAGLMVTSRQDPQRALDLFAHKFFNVVVADHETLEATTGLGFFGEVKKRAPRSPVLVMLAKRTFEAAVTLLRAGAVDVIPKAPDQVGYLRDRVLRAASEGAIDSQREKLLEEAAEIHEEFLKQLLGVTRQVKDLEDKLAGRPPGGAGEEGPLGLLLCDARPFVVEVGALMQKRTGFRTTVAQSGGEALDLVGRVHFHIVVLGDELPDLPATMVMRTLRAQSSDLIAILLTPPGPGRRGNAQIIETSRQIPLLDAIEQPAELAASLDELREAFHAKTRERRYLQVFRERHYEFLRRYIDLRGRLQQLLGKDKPDLSMASGIFRSQAVPKPKPSTG